MYEYCAACCLHFCECEGRKKKRKRHLLLFGREDGDEVARFLSFARSLQRALRKREKHRRKNTRYSKTYHKNGETLIVANAPPPKADTEGSDPGCADFTFSPSFVGVGSIFHSVSLSLCLSVSLSLSRARLKIFFRFDRAYRGFTTRGIATIRGSRSVDGGGSVVPFCGVVILVVSMYEHE